MGRTILLTGLAAIALAAATANAQTGIRIGFGGSRLGGVVQVGGGSGFNGAVTVGRPVIGVPAPGWTRPSTPVHVTPHQVVGYNPWTGAVHTHNTQINNTAFDFGREASRHNGTRRYVNRPVYDNFGNVTGYERGWVWNNSLTGQEHGETQVTRPNGTGGGSSTTQVYRSASPGTQTTTVVRSAAPGTSTTTNVRFARP